MAKATTALGSEAEEGSAGCLGRGLEHCGYNPVSRALALAFLYPASASPSTSVTHSPQRVVDAHLSLGSGEEVELNI